MPFDDRTQRALELVAPRIAAYRGLATSLQERVRGLLAHGGGAPRAARELGTFGAARFDLDRFASLDADASLDSAARSRLRAIESLLGDIAALPSDAFVVDVPEGGRLRYYVASALASLGRLFGAAAAVELVRSGRYEPVSHDDLLATYGFDRWTRAERNVAPPLVVRVAGADLRASTIAEFLDAGVHIVLVVEGRCAPAPLVRLVMPDTLVVQTSDETGLDRVAAYDGPAVAALMPSTSAGFIHDPAAGKHLWQRMRVWSRPATPPRTRLDTWSAAQQAEELAQLDALAERPAYPDQPVESLVAGAADPVDRLASWLLTESGVQ